MLPPAANRPRFPEASVFMGSNPGLVPQTADQKEFACNANGISAMGFRCAVRTLPMSRNRRSAGGQFSPQPVKRWCHRLRTSIPRHKRGTRESIPKLDILKWNVSRCPAFARKRPRTWNEREAVPRLLRLIRHATSKADRLTSALNGHRHHFYRRPTASAFKIDLDGYHGREVVAEQRPDTPQRPFEKPTRR